MASFSDALSDLKSIPTLVERQRKLKRDTDKFLEAQAQSMKAKLGTLKGLSLAEYNEISAAIDDCPWDDDTKNNLLDTLEEGGKAKAKAKSLGEHVRRCMQTCLTFQYYLTLAEITSLSGLALATAKIAQIAQRAFSIGLTCPSEKTVKHLVVLLVHYHHCKTAPDKDTLQEYYDEMKRAIKDLDSNNTYPHEHRKLFPTTPKELPEEMYAFAYPMEEPAVEKEMSLSGRQGPKMRNDKGGRSKAQRDKLDCLLDLVQENKTLKAPRL